MPWSKGESGNPKGAPKRANSFARALRRAFTVGARKAIAERAIAMAKQGDIKAIALIRDTLDGRPTERLEHSGDPDAPIRLVVGPRGGDNDQD